MVWSLLLAGLVAAVVLSARHRDESARRLADTRAIERVAEVARVVDARGDAFDAERLSAAVDRLEFVARVELLRPDRRDDFAALAPGLRAFTEAAREQAGLIRTGDTLATMRLDHERTDPLGNAALDALMLERDRHQALAQREAQYAARYSWLASWIALALVALGFALVGRRRERRAAAEAESRVRAAGDDRFRALFDHHPSPVYVFDADTLAFVEVNPAAVRHYGWTREEFLAMTVDRIRTPAEGERLRRYLAESRGQGRIGGHWRHLRKDGVEIEVEIHATELVLDGRPSVLTVVTDVSERRRLEAELRQAQKMEAIGRLAGGVAHDFNNIITAVQGYAGLLRRELRERPGALEWCDEIGRAAGRAASLTRQLLSFSRRQPVQPVPLDLNAVLVDMHRMLTRLLGEDIDLVTSPAPGLGRVLGDPGQIEQVIMNLAVNARDAMPEGGLLTIETSDVDLDQEWTAARVGVKPGPYVRLDVTDNGTGIPPEVREHIFEPFFTTKESGKGTGLGLATVYGIVQQSGGAISVYSEPGSGTTFSIYLPHLAADGSAAASGAPALPAADPSPGSETVLLVEDEAQLRELARTVLNGAGYRVLEAPHAEAALALAASYPQPIHLLVTDLVMPGVRGTELARQLTERRPGTRVMFMSGYADDATLHAGSVTADTPFLHKPFSPDELLREVRATLDASPTDAR
jgi:two-component system, cell cycle sensor histidine kinase and response regulator CckA